MNGEFSQIKIVKTGVKRDKRKYMVCRDCKCEALVPDALLQMEKGQYDTTTFTANCPECESTMFENATKKELYMEFMNEKIQ